MPTPVALSTHRRSQPMETVITASLQLSADQKTVVPASAPSCSRLLALNVLASHSV
jgi:hypothetical protein